MSFKKKDADLVKLVLVASLDVDNAESDYVFPINTPEGDVPTSMTLEYRVVKRKELIDLLQVLVLMLSCYLSFAYLTLYFMLYQCYYRKICKGLNSG